MRSLTSITMGLMLVVSIPARVAGQDSEAVRTAVLEHYAAIRNADFQAAAYHHTDGFTAFFTDGGLLTTYGTPEEQAGLFQAMGDAGMRANWEVRQLEIRTYGDAAVATGYLVGTLQFPDGRMARGTWQLTEVWVREGGEWKEAHHHDSPLVTDVTKE